MAIFTHVVLGANDVAKSRKFYDAALGALDIKNLGPFGDKAFLYGKDAPEFLITKPANGQPACRVNTDTITTNDDPACVPLNPFGSGQGATFAAAKAYIKANAWQTNVTTENVIAAKKAGVNNYIVKPFNAATLKSKIEAVCGA